MAKSISYKRKLRRNQKLRKRREVHQASESSCTSALAIAPSEILEQPKGVEVPIVHEESAFEEIHQACESSCRCTPPSQTSMEPPKSVDIPTISVEGTSEEIQASESSCVATLAIELLETLESPQSIEVPTISEESTYEEIHHASEDVCSSATAIAPSDALKLLTSVVKAPRISRSPEEDTSTEILQAQLLNLREQLKLTTRHMEYYRNEVKKNC